MHYGDSVWRLSGIGRQSGKRRCFGLTASYPAASQHIPSVPPLPPVFLSHLFLIKCCLPRIGIFATRQEIWEDLISFQGCLSIIFKHHQPYEDAGLSKNHLYADSTSRSCGLISSTPHTPRLSLAGNYHDVCFLWLVDLFKITKWTVSFHLRVHPSQFSFIRQQKRGGGCTEHNTDHANPKEDDFSPQSWWKTEISDQIQSVRIITVYVNTPVTILETVSL